MWKVTMRQNEMLPALVFDEDSNGFRPITVCYLASVAEQIAAEHNELAALRQQLTAAVEALREAEGYLDAEYSDGTPGDSRPKWGDIPDLDTLMLQIRAALAQARGQ